MNRNEARAKTIDILLGDQNPNADFYASLFEKYNYGDSEMTPISPAKMENVNINNCIPCTYTGLNSPIKSKNPPCFRLADNFIDPLRRVYLSRRLLCSSR